MGHLLTAFTCPGKNLYTTTWEQEKGHPGEVCVDSIREELL